MTTTPTNLPSDPSGPQGHATLEIVADSDPQVAQLRLSGEVDASVAPKIRSLTSSLDADSQLLVDLTAVTFMDSAGLGSLIAAIRMTDPEHPAIITCAPGQVRQLLHVTGLDRLATVIEP